MSFLSQYAIKMYNDNLKEIEHIREKQEYMSTIGHYKNALETMKENHKYMAHSPEDLRYFEFHSIFHILTIIVPSAISCIPENLNTFV